jgi:hypothetical protein
MGETQSMENKKYCECREVDFWRPLLSIMEGYRIHPDCGFEIRLDYKTIVQEELDTLIRNSPK